MTTKIQKWGNSLAVRIPKEILRELGWRVGTVVEFTVIEGGGLIINRYKKTAQDPKSFKNNLV